MKKTFRDILLESDFRVTVTPFYDGLHHTTQCATD